jgi:hypothetical protein
MIRSVNSFPMSTLDCSRNPALIDPRPPVRGVPMTGMPELSVLRQRFEPVRSRPFELGKIARAIWPRGRVRPFV